MAGVAGSARALLAWMAATLDNVKFAHTVFALPFCLISFCYAAWPGPSARQLLLVLLAMVFARTAAMSYNRYVDADLDAENPRTRGRPVPSGRLSLRAVLMCTVVSAACFVGVCALLNSLALALSPLALAVVLGYSWSKRFTWVSHLWLGAALAIAPVGGWVAAGAPLGSALPWVLASAVALWVAGFDVIYATQDESFDRERGLHSLVTRLGIRQALWAARFAHVGAVAALGAVWYLADRLGPVYLVGVGLAALCLLWEHLLVRPDDITRVNMAFFTANGIMSCVLCTAALADIYWW